MDQFRVQLLSDGAKSENIVVASDMAEHLRCVGLEWKQADYFHTRTVVLVIEPHIDGSDLHEARARISTAIEALEG